MRELIISKQAQMHLQDIRIYTLNKWGHQQSLKYLSLLKKTSQVLLENPLIGILRTDLFDQVYSFPSGNHIMYYQFTDKTLEILSILHSSQLPQKHLKGRF